MISLNGGEDIKLHSPVRKFRGMVEVYNSTSTLLQTYNSTDSLVSFKIDRIGENNKFFGFGICQKLNVKLRDMDRVINIETDEYFRVGLDCSGIEDEYPLTFGNYYITERNRDENTNQLSITAYDGIYEAGKHYLEEYSFSDCDTFDDYIKVIIPTLKVKAVKYITKDIDLFQTNKRTANFGGSESVRELLNDIAEASQSIYFIDYDNNLVFKRLDKGEPVLTITKEDYFSCKTKANKRLQTICHATQLGDNISASTAAIGSTQYIRENFFWTKNPSVQTFVESAIRDYGGLTIGQFSCSWRGDYRLEPGDKIGIVNKDGSVSYSYVFNDTLEYNGGFKMDSNWSYEDSGESPSNPSSLGEALNNTFAIVDKVNNTVNIVASQQDKLNEKISQIEMDTGNISLSVEETKRELQQQIESSENQTNNKVGELTNKVNATLTSTDVKLEINNYMKEQGEQNSITTSTGFTFDKDGLRVSKTDSDISTQITENGMRVNINNSPVLTANHEGVEAKNLKATTYLIIGDQTRIEHTGYSIPKTCIYWIGK